LDLGTVEKKGARRLQGGPLMEQKTEQGDLQAAKEQCVGGAREQEKKKYLLRFERLTIKKGRRNTVGLENV